MAVQTALQRIKTAFEAGLDATARMRVTFMCCRRDDDPLRDYYAVFMTMARQTKTVTLPARFVLHALRAVVMVLISVVTTVRIRDLYSGGEDCSGGEEFHLVCSLEMAM